MEPGLPRTSSTEMNITQVRVGQNWLQVSASPLTGWTPHSPLLKLHSLQMAFYLVEARPHCVTNDPKTSGFFFICPVWLWLSPVWSSLWDPGRWGNPNLEPGFMNTWDKRVMTKQTQNLTAATQQWHLSLPLTFHISGSAFNEQASQSSHRERKREKAVMEVTMHRIIVTTAHYCLRLEWLKVYEVLDPLLSSWVAASPFWTSFS